MVPKALRDYGKSSFPSLDMFKHHQVVCFTSLTAKCNIRMSHIPHVTRVRKCEDVVDDDNH